MKRTQAFVIVVTLAACRSSRLGSNIQPAPSASASVAPSASSASSAPPAPSASSESSPRALAVVVEGPCSELGVSFFQNATLVHYGHIADSRSRGEPRPVLAFVGDDGSVVADAKLSRGLPTDSIPELDIGQAAGTWPTAATLVLFHHGSERYDAESFRYVRRGDAWVDGRNAPDPPGSPWVSGSSWLSGSRLLHFAAPQAPGFKVVPDGGAPVPALASSVPDAGSACWFSFDDVVTRPNGDLFVAGQFCGVGSTHTGTYRDYGGAAVGRWSPATKGVIDRLPPVKEGQELHLSAFAEASPTTLYVIGNADWEKQEPYVAFHDGSRWSRIPTPFAGVVEQQGVDPDGLLWIRTRKGELRRYDPAAKTWTLEPLADVTDASLVGGRVAWAIAGGNVMHREAGGAWVTLPVPHPAFTTTRADFSLKGLEASPRGEVWVTATYEERRPEWSEAERRQALLRYGPPVAATRCDLAKESSFGPWPPAATDACTTPFVVLARISASAPADYDYPQTRRALRGHEEMVDAELVEVDLDGKRVLGAKVKSVDVGKRIVALQGKMVRTARPELVCTDPKVIRALP